MKKRRTDNSLVNMAVFNDLCFPRTCPGADYDLTWTDSFHDRNIFAITACYESAVLFAAREGWVNATAPVCEHQKCVIKHSSVSKRRSYIYNRKDINGWVWRYPCC